MLAPKAALTNALFMIVSPIISPIDECIAI
jgi:hypothetical protein